MPDYEHEPVNHSVGEYVRGKAHSKQGHRADVVHAEAGHKGTYHRMSWKHLNRYVGEFAGRQKQGELDTLDQMAEMVLGMGGKGRRYKHHRNKPPSREMPTPIPDAPENVAKAVLNTPPEKRDEWKYLKPRRDEKPYSSRPRDP